MNAAVVEQFGKPLTLKEVDIPTPAAGQILVKTEACGVCHTDLHAAHGDWPVKPTLPFIPGHEAIGLVVAVGSGVKIAKEGDRVGVPWLYSTCGDCEYCLAGWETVCAQAQFGGYTKNGGFAEYLLADPNYVAHVPAGLAAADAAPLICAGILTSFPALHAPGDPVPPILGTLLRKPFAAQAVAISGAAKKLQQADSVAIIAEMGTGKTLMAVALTHVVASGRPYACLFIVPAQILLKTAREILQTIPGARTYVIDSLRSPRPSQTGPQGVNELRLRNGRIVRDGVHTTLTDMRLRRKYKSAWERWVACAINDNLAASKA